MAGEAVEVFLSLAHVKRKYEQMITTTITHKDKINNKYNSHSNDNDDNNDKDDNNSNNNENNPLKTDRVPSSLESANKGQTHTHTGYPTVPPN